MHSPSISTERARVMPRKGASRVGVALRVGRAVNACAAAYSDLLKQMVLNNKSISREDAFKYSKHLDSEDGQLVLTIFWRESSFVSEEALLEADLIRELVDGCTAYGIARKIAPESDDLAAVNTKVRNIAIAAEAYGLIQREKITSTNKPIVATELLHKFIIAVTDEQHRHISEIFDKS